MADFITVKAVLTDGRVALYEASTGHVTKANPTGEIYIVGDGKAHTVAQTAEVAVRIKDGILVEVGKVQEFPADVPPVVPPAQTKLKTEASKG